MSLRSSGEEKLGVKHVSLKKRLTLFHQTEKQPKPRASVPQEAWAAHRRMRLSQRNERQRKKDRTFPFPTDLLFSSAENQTRETLREIYQCPSVEKRARKKRAREKRARAPHEDTKKRLQPFSPFLSSIHTVI